MAQAEIDGAAAQCGTAALDALKLARERIEVYHRRQVPKDERYDRRARRRARLALDRDRGGRPLCAGRHCGLSVFRADECGAGKGRRRAAPRHGRAVAGRQAQSAGAGRGALAGCRRDLSHRRRAGGGGARLRHRNDRAGRQDRRPRQCLCRGRQAPGLRHGRHRHDRRAVGGPGVADRDNDPDWIAADLLAQAEHDVSRAVHPDYRRCVARRAVEKAVERQLARLPRGNDRRRDAGAISAPSSCAQSRRGRAAGRPHRAGAPSRSPPATPRSWPSASATPARSSSARIRRKRSATMSRAPTTCCRPRARRASPPASACSTS